MDIFLLFEQISRPLPPFLQKKNTSAHSMYARAYDMRYGYGRRHEACMQRRERDVAASSTQLHSFNGAKILEQLMAVNLTVVNHKLCQVAYFVLDITKNMICADGDFFLGGASTCEGDSGGVGAIDGIARGIVSFGRGCGQPLSPSAFTDISAPAIRNFIAKHTGL
ncbi:unnamed protein product [Parnassius apollo]|uniref:(apollo) hypothetical protein n=1 Tax=Parnassius apollo TaxID=110799 RepID=A0A8S3WY69_PARAO|nr:unnamed protein product [Parnassius apollo]